MATKKKTAPKRSSNFDALKKQFAEAAAKFNELLDQVMHHDMCEDVEVCFDGIYIERVNVYKSVEDDVTIYQHEAD